MAWARGRGDGNKLCDRLWVWASAAQKQKPDGNKQRSDKLMAGDTGNLEGVCWRCSLLVIALTCFASVNRLKELGNQLFRERKFRQAVNVNSEKTLILSDSDSSCYPFTAVHRRAQHSNHRPHHAKGIHPDHSRQSCTGVPQPWSRTRCVDRRQRCPLGQIHRRRLTPKHHNQMPLSPGKDLVFHGQVRASNCGL